MGQLYLHSPLSDSPTAPMRLTTVCEPHRQQVTLRGIRSNVLSIDTITAVSVTHAIPRIDRQEWYFAALAGQVPSAKADWIGLGVACIDEVAFPHNDPLPSYPKSLRGQEQGGQKENP